MAKSWGVTPKQLEPCVNAIFSKEKNPWTQGITKLKEDLLFAEDLVMVS
jgi:hypothetical protein